jgi:predicted acylesterase/phospholipase RssA
MSATINKIGLALSGGGFRATFYHLGLVRFLRDAGILSRVSQITSVSGGSVFAAHLMLNWGRYNGSPEDFEAAASELIAFVRLDVRNRIVRRFPLTLPLRWLRRPLGLPTRKLSRTGLLEYHYEKFLYGDKSLFERLGSIDKLTGFKQALQAGRKSGGRLTTTGRSLHRSMGPQQVGGIAVRAEGRRTAAHKAITSRAHRRRTQESLRCQKECGTRASSLPVRYAGSRRASSSCQRA